MGKLKVRDLRESMKFMRQRMRYVDRMWKECLERILLPCPFCQEEADIFTKYNHSTNEGHLIRPVWIAGCPTCEVYQGSYYIEDMVRLWNHRVYYRDPDLEPWKVDNLPREHFVDPVVMRMCPFCGKEPVLRRGVRYRGPAREVEVPTWVIECRRCDVLAESKDLAALLQAWNRRADAPDEENWAAGRIKLEPDWMWNWHDMELSGMTIPPQRD